MIPFDLISLGLGSAVGLIKHKMDNSAKLAQAQQKLMFKDRQANRETKNKFYQWTRRVIALSFVAYLLVPAVLAGIFHWPYVVSYIEVNGWLMSWFTGNTTVVFKQFHGFVLAPGVMATMTYIIGFYFSAPTTRQ